MDFFFLSSFKRNCSWVPNKSTESGHCIGNDVLKVLLSERQTLGLEYGYFDDTRRNFVGLCKLAAHL